MTITATNGIIVTNENRRVSVTVGDGAGFTDEERQNLLTVESWANDYNTDPVRYVLENYVEDCTVDMPGAMILRGQKTLEAFCVMTVEQNPERHLTVDRVLPSGSSITIQGELVVPRPSGEFRSPYVVILDLRDGKIVKDTSFLDLQAWMQSGVFPQVDPAQLAGFELEITDTIGRFG